MNFTILFYNKDTGYAVTGTLQAGVWEPGGLGGSVKALPAGYTNAAASRDTLVLYHRETGAGETGTFTDGEYHRTESLQWAVGWSHVVATHDSVLFYDEDDGRAASGTLQGGVYREKRGYSDFNKHWQSIAASFDTVVFTKGAGAVGFPETAVAYGVLHDGVYLHGADRTDDGGVTRLVATKDTALELRMHGSTSHFHVAVAMGGLVDRFREIGTGGGWDLVGRTADSLFFYQSDGTCWGSKLLAGHHTNVGPISDVLPAVPGWSLIAGGV